MKEIIELPDGHALAQSFYVAPDRMGLKPNCVFTKNGKVVFETNTLGLMGPEPDTEKRLAVIWGDSVIFGCTYGRASWIEQLNDKIEGYQFMNGGIEGMGVDNILGRAIRMNEKVNIDVNIIFPGWHPSWLYGPENGQIESWLDEALGQKLKNSMLVTLPTSLTPEILDTDIRPYRNIDANTGTEDFFNLWGDCDCPPETIRTIYNRMLERNHIIRRVAARHSVILFDWFEAMKPSSFDEGRRLFFDIPHPRPSAYDVIFRVWGDWLQMVLIDAGMPQKKAS